MVLSSAIDQTDLVTSETSLVVNIDFKAGVILLHLNPRRSTKISVCIIAVSKRQSFNVMMVLEVGCTVIEKTSNAASLES